VLGFILGAAELAIQIGSAFGKAKAQDKAAKLNKAAALASERADFQALGVQEQQVQERSTETILAAHRQAVNADASARVNAGAAGVAGASVDAILADISRQESSYDVQEQRNTEATLRQIQQQKQGIEVETQNRIAGVQPSNPLATALTIGAAGLNFATNQIKLGNPGLGNPAASVTPVNPANVPLIIPVSH
jgi:hypothetical protein